MIWGYFTISILICVILAAGKTNLLVPFKNKFKTYPTGVKDVFWRTVALEATDLACSSLTVA